MCSADPVTDERRQRIDAVRDMLSPSLRRNIEFVADVEENIWPVEVDLGELELALINIAVNARDAMPDGGTITLSARNVVLKPGAAATPEALRAFVREHLAHFKCPHRFNFVADLPKTATGKIQKFVLRGRDSSIAAQ